jgi:PAS domain S-box-containing protein
MRSEVPESGRAHGPGQGLPLLAEALDALLELTGAAAGWVGLTGRDGLLTFPARRGPVPDGWLALQGGWVPVWGFQVADGPSVVNNLPALPALGEPPLRNLLTCPLRGGAAGQIALANKPGGFTDADAAAVQTTAHLLGRQLATGPTCSAPAAAPGVWQRALDRVAEGVLVVRADGRLLFANAAWAHWTGYSADELRDRPAPFPFWVSAADLAGTALPALALPAAPRVGARQPSVPVYLPFRRRDRSVFWCQVELATETSDGRPVTVAVLRQLPAPPGPAAGAGDEPGAAVAFRALAEALPFPAALTDRQGQLIWVNAAFREELLPGAAAGQPLRQAFTPTSAAALERLLRDRPRAAETWRCRLVLEQAGPAGRTRSWTAMCLAADWADGTGFLFALAEDWAELWPADEAPAPWLRAGARAADLLPLLYRPGRPLAFWDARWNRLTGLSQGDQAGVAGEIVLDWLFPRQHDRDWVADLLQHPARRGGQAVLEVVSPTGSRPLACTLLPLAPEDGWLLLAGEPEAAGNTARLLQRFLQPFARELGRLLDQDATRRPAPAGNGGAVDRLSWLGRLLDNCLRACQLLVALQDLTAMPSAGESEPVRLAEVVRALLDESAGPAAGDYELTVEVRDAEAVVRAHPVLLKLVLGHLLRQAAEAVRGRERRHITVQVYVRNAEAVCEISDTGAGWPAADWDALLAASALLPESSDLPLEASGLALTVSQHLLTLQGGRLELRSRPGEGRTAVLTLPRADVAAHLKGPHAAPEPGPRAEAADVPKPPARADG